MTILNILKLIQFTWLKKIILSLAKTWVNVTNIIEKERSRHKRDTIYRKVKQIKLICGVGDQNSGYL